MEPARSRLADPWVHAAAAYALYGAIYLTCAAVQLNPERKAQAGGYWWAWFVVGAAVAVAVPILILRRSKWFTRIMALGPTVKALVLLWRQAQRLGAGEPTVPLDWLLAAAAIVAAVLMTRAGWSTPRPGPPAD